MEFEKILKYLSLTAGIVAGLFLFPFFIRSFSPFVAAFIVATPAQRIVDKLETKIHLNRGISSAIISTAIVGVATLIVIFLSFQLYTQAKNLVTALPATIDSFRGQLNSLSESFNIFKHNLPVELNQVLDNIALNFKDYAQEFSHRATSNAITAAGGLAAKLPGFVLFLTMFILSTFFFTKDYPLIINFFKELLPQKIIYYLGRVKAFTITAFSSYLKAQLILMAMTSALITVCLWIIGKEYPLLWGIICGAIDALPFLGTAVIIVPWALASLVFGDWYSFISLLVIQGLVFLVRQLAEPKVVSKQIGIHPILTLVSVYIGLRYFGIIGMLLAPIIMLLIVNLYVSYRESK
ncbi:MAG: sporulation integral membrane protein YtvI [Clostridia bacterium]|nr:sporulation integral membrane protein YtvI [Clostridia bacterium]